MYASLYMSKLIFGKTITMEGAPENRVVSTSCRSEGVNKIGVEEERLRDSQFINKSPEDVIHALVLRNPHVPKGDLLKLLIKNQYLSQQKLCDHMSRQHTPTESYKNRVITYPTTSLLHEEEV